MILSNPPYIPTSDRDGLQPEVRDFEPHQALFGGEDGLELIRRIVEDAPRFLDPRGHLLLEIGFGQAKKVGELFDREIWREPDLVADLQGISRLVVSELV
jgi:release factor glutamine methyltransferase